MSLVSMLARTGVSFGIIHNRLRDWGSGDHPGYALGSWLRDYQEQVWLFTRDFSGLDQQRLSLGAPGALTQ